MSTLHPVYELVMGEWEQELEDIEKKIFQALKRAYPEGRTRRELIRDVYGSLVPDDVDLNNNANDRKIRKTIAKMFDDLIPIVSSSGAAGYRLDLSEQTIRSMINEWHRRREQYAHKIERGERLILKIKQVGEAAIPESLPEEPRQLSFIR
jgi:DNA invertase Pin-like site-specific DNA recombinase